MRGLARWMRYSLVLIAISGIILVAVACGGGRGGADAPNLPQQLAISGAALPGANQGVVYAATINASGGSGLGYTWLVVTGALPPGLNLGGGTPSATLSGTPGAQGTYNFELEVTDSDLNTALRGFVFNIGAPIPLVISTATLQDGVAGFSYSELVTAAGGSGQGYTWSVISGALPAGIGLSGATPSATLSGVPGGAGSFTFEVEVLDSAFNSDSRVFTMDVNPAPAGIFVDGTLSAPFTATYDPVTRSATGGFDTAYDSLTGAAAVAVAGDTVLIRGGTFNEQLIPQNSGTAAMPITWKAYPGETPTITGSTLRPAVDISYQDYLILDGLTVTDVQRWMYAVDAHYNVIRNCTFRNAVPGGGSTKSGLFFEQSTYNRVENCTLNNGVDLLSFTYLSDYNIAEGNTFLDASHTLWVIRGSNYCIIRNNTFYNSTQKIGEVFDCYNYGLIANYTSVDATRHNLIENNEFQYSASSGNSSPFAGIQFAGQECVVRHNRFYDTVGPALSITSYGDEAENTHDNRIFHNVFYGTDFAGISIAKQISGYQQDGNVIKNNILTRSVFVANDTRWNWYTGELAGKPVQVMAGRLSGYLFDTNCIFNNTVGETYTITYGQRDNSSNWPQQYGAAWWVTNYPSLFQNNIEADPMYVNEGARDFHLQSGSPMIDSATWLTTTSSAGSGTVMSVADALYFYDGYGIPGEVGDVIQLEGQTQTATITAINYTTNQLTLSTSLTWTSGQGLSLAYNGSGPDLGSYEK